MFIKSSTFSVYLDVRTKFDNVSSQYKADLMRVSYFLSENERSSDENRFLQINLSFSDEYFFFILKTFNQVLFLLFNSVSLCYRLWLSKFEEISKTFNSSEQFETLFATSQLADQSWKSWSQFNLLHLIILCAMSFAFCFILSVLYECTIYT